MKRKILDAGLAVLLSGALIAMIYMGYTVRGVHAENQQLKHINAELQLEYYKMQIQRDEAVDAVWHDNNSKMMEGEGD
ncbi:hypothetical protein [Oceanobacillus neutriphilus]|uniref:TMhelix containing protein n=1 Tax=Oceanobacillus neutriphilus TaxID=531815 RepID=A0ABQ2P3P0_9BACI|nr:hypothetical protein [Oceanobacillus neutriphilus]GGP17300.1 hypothetical protein GCM10011346_52620 [Oceanobacillus neutriphilus]